MKYLKDIKDWKECINEVVCGDCLEGMKLIPDKSIDLVICDLPYGTTACSWDTVIPFEPLWEQYKRIGKENCAYILFGSQPFTTDLINSNRGWFKYELVWSKIRPCGTQTAKIRPLKYHENICVFYDKLPLYNPQMVSGAKQKKGSGGKSDIYGDNQVKRFENSDYYPGSILNFLSCHNMTGKAHPTEKPIELLRWIINSYANSDYLILDNCMGSWTTARACKDLGRNFIGFEISEKYCKIGEERLRQEVLF